MTALIQPSSPSRARARVRSAFRVAVPAVAAVAMSLTFLGSQASAGIVATVPMGTAAQFSVLGASTVTNVPGSATRLHQDLGLYAGSSVTGFTAANLVAPAAQHITDSVAQVAQNDLTIAYTNAFNRPAEFTVPVDLGGSVLIPGVYQSTGAGALGLTGPLVLDAGGNQDAVFIFKSSSTLTTAAASTVQLLNGAKECNVFWQVGSSATLGTGSTFVGNILALTDIDVANSVTVHGRALARNGQVTLDNDTFEAPLCPATVPAATTTTAAAATTTPATTVAPGTPTTGAATTPTAGPSDTSVATGGTSPVAAVLGTLPRGVATIPGTPSFNGTDITLPRTGSGTSGTAMFGAVALVLGTAALLAARRRRAA